MSVLVKNVSGQEIPAYALMLATGAERLTNNRIAIKVDSWVNNPEAEILLVNGSFPIGITGDQRYSNADIVIPEPFWAAYDASTGTPAFGELWGLDEGEWQLKKDVLGFTILGLPDSQAGRVLCVKDLSVQVRDAIVSSPSMTAASDPKTGATTGRATFLVPDPSDPDVMIDGDEFDFTNRSINADASTGTYIIVVRIGREWRPVWADC